MNATKTKPANSKQLAEQNRKDRKNHARGLKRASSARFEKDYPEGDITPPLPDKPVTLASIC